MNTKGANMNLFSHRVAMFDGAYHRLEQRRNCLGLSAIFAFVVGIAVYAFSDLPAVATIMPALMIAVGCYGFLAGVELTLEELRPEQTTLRELNQATSEMEVRERRLLERESAAAGLPPL